MIRVLIGFLLLTFGGAIVARLIIDTGLWWPLLLVLPICVVFALIVSPSPNRVK